MVYKNKLWILLLACFSSFSVVSAQQVDAKSKATQDIIKLQEGTLVVRLPSSQKKIQKLLDLLDKPNLSNNDKKNIKKELDRTMSSKENQGLAFINALNEFYTFSNYLIMYDTATVHFKNQLSSGYFLNDQLETDPSIKLDFSKPTFLLRVGTTKTTESRNPHGLYVTDSKLTDLAAPFPYFTRTSHSFSAVFNVFFGKENEVPKYSKMVSKLNGKFKRFYLKRMKALEKERLTEKLDALKNET